MYGGMFFRVLFKELSLVILYRKCSSADRVFVTTGLFRKYASRAATI